MKRNNDDYEDGGFEKFKKTKRGDSGKKRKDDERRDKRRDKERRRSGY